MILKVCKYVLQLVENLAFMPCVHLESICKCVLQFELKFLIILVLSELSVLPACTTRYDRGAVVPHVPWRNYRVTFGPPNVSSDRVAKRRGPKVQMNLSRPRGKP